MKNSAFLLLLGITTAVWADIQPCNHVEEPHQEVAAFLAASAPDTGARQAAAIRAAREGDSTDLDAIRKGRNSSAEAAATDASLVVHHRELGRIRLPGHRRHHLYRTGRAMAGAVVTCHLIPVHDAVLFDPYGVAYLDG